MRTNGCAAARSSRSSESDKWTPRLFPADGVDLVDDDITNGGKDHSRLLRRQHQIQRFGVVIRMSGGMLEDRRPFGLCRIPYETALRSFARRIDCAAASSWNSL